MVGWTIRHAAGILTVALLAALASAIAMLAWGLPTYYALSSFVGQQDPEFAKLERFMAQFGVGELALIAVYSDDAFAPDTQECLEQLVARIERLRVAQSIRCLVQVPPLMRRIVASSPLVRGILVSDDQRTAAIVMQMRLDRGAGPSRRDAVTALRAALADSRRQFPALRFVATGPYFVTYEMFELVRVDLAVFCLLSLLPIGAILWLALGTWRLTLYPIVVAILSVLSALGFTILFRLNTALNLQTIVLLVAVLTIATCVHLAVGQSQDRGNSRRTVRRLAWPCTGVIVTSIGGFASVAISPVQPVRTFSLIMSVGLSWSLLLSLAAAVPWLRQSGRDTTAQHWLEVGLLRLAVFSERKSLLIIGLFTAAALACLPAIARFQYDSNFLNNFRPSTSIRRNYQFVESNLTPMQSIELLIRCRDGSPALRADAVRAIRETSKTLLARHPLLARSLSVADLLTAMGTELPGDDRTLRQQLTWTQSLSRLAVGEHALDSFVTADRRTLRVTFLAREGASVAERIAVANDVRLTTQAALGPDYTTEVTGIYLFYATLLSSLLADQGAVLTVSLACLLGGMWFFLRSWRLAVIGMVPNLFAALTCVGLMGYLQVPFNMVTSMILAVSLGITVDDTIHYLWRYRSERRRGLHSGQAIIAAHESVGRACSITTIVLATGLGVMFGSRFLPIAYFGGITSLVMLLALAANLMLLPALLNRIDPLVR